MKVILIAAIGLNGELGLDNKLLWKSPSDLNRFKTITEGHPIIMGNNTFKSLPGILPNRKHYIVTSKLLVDNRVESVHSIKDALLGLQGLTDKVFIIGGASIYKQALELDLVDELLITHMNWEGKADTFLRLDYSKWELVDTVERYIGEVGPNWSQKHYVKGKV